MKEAATLHSGPTPRVSVCIDSYNYGRFLRQAIDSVLSQTLTDFELIILDDASTDDSFQIAQTYAAIDPRVIVHRNESNLGMLRNRNACLARARGDYVKFLHADDFLCAPDALDRMCAFLESNPAISLVASARRIVEEAGHPSDTWSCFDADTRPPIAGTTVITRCLREQRNLIGGPSAVMCRRGRAARGFSEEYFVMADLEMWFHLLEQGCFAYLSEPLVAFRQHGLQQTQKDKQTLDSAIENRRLLMTYLPRPYVRLRPWIKRFLVYDSVRRIARRSRKLRSGEELVVEALREYGGRARFLRNTPSNFGRELVLKLQRLFGRHIAPRLRRIGRSRSGLRPPRGVNVAGFAKGEYGIGESTRSLWRAVRSSGLPAVLLNVHSRMHRNLDGSLGDFSRTNPYAVNLMTFSFDYSRRFHRDMGAKFTTGRYNIGFWYWEQDRFPARFHSAFDFYDEVWVPTRYIEKSLKNVSPIPVRKITYPLYVNEEEARSDRRAFALPEQSYVFLFSFDFLSTTIRKNPLGVIHAFQKAFRNDDRVVLVVKSINAHHDPGGRAFLAQNCGGSPVVFEDSHLSASQINALFASADCYVSLHRSEGLGLGLAQSMYLAKPVIGTGYSGNLEFMNDRNSYLVQYRMTTLEEGSGPYEAGTMWAEPDIEHAAELMRNVYLDQEESATRGRLAAAEIRETLNPKRTEREIAAAVDELLSSAAARPPRFC